MAFYNDTGFGQDFYPDQGLQDITNLSNLQAMQAPIYGQQAAQYADPFMSQRGQYQKQLSDLLANPGSFASSPAYQFAYNQGLDALQRKGNVRSGNKLAALQNYGQQAASQLYFPQAQLLSNLAISGSSPAAAGVAYQRGTERGQDYAQLGTAARSASRQAPMPTNTTPWWAQTQTQPTSQSSSALPYSNLGGLYGGMSGSVDYNTPGYTPSSYSGTGYVTTNGNTTTFGGYDPYSDPYFNSGISSDTLGDYGNYGDYLGDYGDYSGDYE